MYNLLKVFGYELLGERILAILHFVMQEKTFSTKQIASKLEELGVPAISRKPGMLRNIPVKLSVECARRICALFKSQGLVTFDGNKWSYTGELPNKVVASKMEQQRIKAYDACVEIHQLLKQARIGKTTKPVVSESCLRSGLSFWYYFDFAIAAKAELDIIKASDSRNNMNNKDALKVITGVKQSIRNYIDDNTRRSTGNQETDLRTKCESAA